MKAPWRNLNGPARPLAACATILLVASGLGAVEAAAMMILGPALLSDQVRDMVLKPLVIAAYLEGCAVFFSVIGIVVSFVCLIFYRPYLFLREKMFLLRARRAGQVSDDHTWFEPAYQGHGHVGDEDGAPD